MCCRRFSFRKLERDSLPASRQVRFTQNDKKATLQHIEDFREILEGELSYSNSIKSNHHIIAYAAGTYLHC